MPTPTLGIPQQVRPCQFQFTPSGDYFTTPADAQNGLTAGQRFLILGATLVLDASVIHIEMLEQSKKWAQSANADNQMLGHLTHAALCLPNISGLEFEVTMMFQEGLTYNFYDCFGFTDPTLVNLCVLILTFV